MVRRVAGAALAASVLALGGCGGKSGGLETLEQASAGVSLRCGETSNWEAAVLANRLKRPVTVNAVAMKRVPPGFTLEWARVYYGPLDTIDESRAKRSVLGHRIPPTKTESPGTQQGWHVVVGLKLPPCLPETRRPEFDAREYKVPERALELGYLVGSEERRLRLGSELSVVVCAGRRGCRP